jgi:hypothetical protein
MTVLYIVIAVLVGWFIGFLDSNLRTAKKIQALEANAEIKIRDAEKKIALASQSANSPQDDPGLLRLKNDNGRFVLEMDGTPVAVPLSPDKKKRLIELITVFRPWIEGGQLAQAASQPAAPLQTPPVPDPVQPAVSRSVQPATPTVKKPEAEKNITSLSIVNQIDTVLQARLVDTPLAKRGIRLQESSQGGVEVYVGLEKFSTVDDVSDETIKAAIRAAIAEWEEKYTPGL